MSNYSSHVFDRRRTLRGHLCALLALLLAAGDAFAWQAPADKDAERDRANWEKVRDIGPDKEIQVETRPSDSSSAIGHTYRGHLLKWAPDSVVVQLRKGGDKEISKSLVRNVSLKEKGNRRKGVLLGGVVGFGLGALIGADAGCPDCNNPTGGQRMSSAGVFGAIFGAIGAGVGAAVSGTKMVTAYRAP